MCRKVQSCVIRAIQYNIIPSTNAVFKWTLLNLLYKRVTECVAGSGPTEPTAEMTSGRRTKRLSKLSCLQTYEGLSADDKLKVTLKVYNLRVDDHKGWPIPVEEYFSDKSKDLYEWQDDVITLCGQGSGTLTPSLLLDNSLVESNKFFISPSFFTRCYSECPHLKVKVSRLGLRLISTSLSLKYTFRSLKYEHLLLLSFSYHQQDKEK